jgi:hypothetical protein
MALDAVRIDPQQDLHRVPGPLGDQRRRGPGIQPPGDSGMPEVVGPADQWRGELGRGDDGQDQVLSEYILLPTAKLVAPRSVRAGDSFVRVSA